MTDIALDEKLAPCPFCGGKAKIVEGEESAYVQCVEVKMHRALWFDGDNDAANEIAEQWNRRSSPSQVAPANPAQVTGFDAVCQILAELQYEGVGFRDRDIEPIAQRIFAAIGAGGQAVAEPALCQYEFDDGTIDHYAGCFGEIHEVNGKKVVRRTPLYLHPASATALSHPHPADERVVEALRMAHSFIARECRDEKSIALEGEFVSKEARPVFRALSDALAAKEGL